MKIPDVGLVVFVIVVLTNFAGLYLDGLLAARDLPTVTDMVLKYQYLGIIILVFYVIGALGLFAHFYFRSQINQ